MLYCVLDSFRSVCNPAALALPILDLATSARPAQALSTSDRRHPEESGGMEDTEIDVPVQEIEEVDHSHWEQEERVELAQRPTKSLGLRAAHRLRRRRGRHLWVIPGYIGREVHDCVERGSEGEAGDAEMSERRTLLLRSALDVLRDEEENERADDGIESASFCECSHWLCLDSSLASPRLAEKTWTRPRNRASAERNPRGAIPAGPARKQQADCQRKTRTIGHVVITFPLIT